MANPTISTTGTLSGMLLITDQDGAQHHIPKSALSDLVNTSNQKISRLEVYVPNGFFLLVFDTPEALNSFVVSVEAQY